MKNFRIILLLLFSSISFQSIAQSDEEVQPTNMDKLLEVVREGRSKEKAENQKRESEFLSNRELFPLKSLLLKMCLRVVNKYDQPSQGQS